MRELHFGTVVADPLSSLLMNDLGGIGMFILSVTGLLYWALPKYWKVQAKSRSQSGSGHPNSNSEQTLKAAKAATKKATGSRCIDVTYETVRKWAQRYGQSVAKNIRHRSPVFCDK